MTNRMVRITKLLPFILCFTCAAGCKKNDRPPTTISGIGEISAGIDGETVVYGNAIGEAASAFGLVYDKPVTLSPEINFPAKTFVASHTNIINGSLGMIAQITIYVPQIQGTGEFDIVALGGSVQLTDTRSDPQDGYLYGIGQDFPGSSGTLYIDQLGPRVGNLGRIAKGSILGKAKGRKVGSSQPGFDREVLIEVIFNQDLEF